MRWMLACTLLLALCACKREKPADVIDLGVLPTWTMTAEDGTPIGTEQLHGKVWIANFLFTSCQSSCPPLAKATAQLQDRLRPLLPKDGPSPVQIVSISVDPVTDTPPVLAAFAKNYGADPRIWRFATGEYDAMEHLVTDGFLLPLERGDVPPKGVPGHDHNPLTGRPTPVETAHSLRFVVVDQEGHVRGTWDKDEAGLQRTLNAARWLAGL